MTLFEKELYSYTRGNPDFCIEKKFVERRSQAMENRFAHLLEIPRKLGYG